jgi:hypothetical protein
MKTCTDDEVSESGECLYISVKNCVLPKCAFGEAEEEYAVENPYGVIETGTEESG